MADYGDGEKVPAVMVIEAHEELIQHIEAGQRKVRTLAVITIIVAFFLIASYSAQLILPFSSGTRYVQVDLLDPSLLATQILLIILVGAWLYVGILNYLFSTRMGRQVREIRALERDLEKRITG